MARATAGTINPIRRVIDMVMVLPFKKTSAANNSGRQNLFPFCLPECDRGATSGQQAVIGRPTTADRPAAHNRAERRRVVRNSAGRKPVARTPVGRIDHKPAAAVVDTAPA